MKNSCINTFVFLCLLPFGVASQQYNFRNYSVKDGVAQSQVYSLLQDKRGYLWMGTRGGGLSRFDGINFKTFTEKNGLTNNYIYDIQEDKQKVIWIGTNDGLSSYNGIEFKTYKFPGADKPVEIRKIAFDRKGRTWLASSIGVLLFSKGKFINISAQLRQKPSIITSVLVDKGGTIWFGSGKGLFRIKEKRNRFHLLKMGKIEHSMNNAITCIKEDVNGSLWVGTYGDGVYVYNHNFFYRIDGKLELYKQTVLDIYFDQSGNAWLATLNKGAAQYNMVSKSFNWLSENEGLSNNHVRAIIQDNAGNFWFGTSGGGVCSYFGKQFTTYDKNSGLGGNFIYSIYKDSKKRLWVGNSQKGVSCMTDSGFCNFDSKHGFIDAKIKAICEDLKGNMYFGTDGQGVYTYDGSAFKSVSGLEKKYVRSMLCDDDGNIWFATAGNGLFKLELKDEDPVLKNFTVDDGLLHNRLTCLHYDKLGRVWYGTEDNGVGFIKNDQPQKQVFRMKEGLPSNLIRCFSEDKTGLLWIGTAGSGIVSLSIYKKKFECKTYDHRDGLTSSNIYLLTFDLKNNLIVGTETGLDYIFLNGKRSFSGLKHYSKGDGFTGVETCQNAVFNDPNGSIWFGTINGLSNYNPANAYKNEHEPVTNITDVKLFYESLSKTSYKDAVSDWNQVKYLKLPYDQNHLSFDFFAINLSNPDAVRYKWKLVGFDGNWSPPSKEHSIVYSNINPGKYTFLVKACNEDGIWNKKAKSISFEIDSPVWLLWWFILGEVLIIIGIVLLIFRWQFNRIKSKSTEAQQKLLMAKEIVELEQKALRLQMNPHFIFNALNSIQAQIGTGNEQEARYYLAKFSRLMRHILDNSRNALITLEEEVNTLENYLMIEKFCNGSRFDYEIDVESSIETDYIKIPPMLLQPFVENAIKHGLKYVGDDIRGLIKINFTEKDSFLECSVTDNGIGRDKAAELNQNSKETYHKSTSLIVTQDRLDLLHENENIQNLEIVDLFDDQRNVLGTKVIVRIPIN